MMHKSAHGANQPRSAAAKDSLRRDIAAIQAHDTLRVSVIAMGKSGTEWYAALQNRAVCQSEHVAWFMLSMNIV